MISFFLTAKRLLGAIVVLWKEKVFLSLVTTLLLINLSGTLFYSGVEGWSYFEAFYFSWVSLIPTSIDLGYAPVTTFGKVFTDSPNKKAHSFRCGMIVRSNTEYHDQPKVSGASSI